MSLTKGRATSVPRSNLDEVRDAEVTVETRGGFIVRAEEGVVILVVIERHRAVWCHNHHIRPFIGGQELECDRTSCQQTNNNKYRR